MPWTLAFITLKAMEKPHSERFIRFKSALFRSDKIKKLYDSGSSGGNPVEVRVLFRALLLNEELREPNRLPFLRARGSSINKDAVRKEGDLPGYIPTELTHLGPHLLQYL